MTTHFVLGYELQQHGHRVTFLNILDAQDKILAADFGFRATGESERPIGSDAKILAQRGKSSGMASLKHTLKTVEPNMRLILQYAPEVIRSQGIESESLLAAGERGRYELNAIAPTFLNRQRKVKCTAFP